MNAILSRVALLMVLGAASTETAMAQYVEPKGYRLQFDYEKWAACSLVLHDQVQAAKEEGYELSFHWYDFSPLQFPAKSGPLLDREAYFRPETVDVQLVIATMEPIRAYVQSDNPRTNSFLGARSRRYLVYEDMLGYLTYSDKAPGIRESFVQVERAMPLERSEIGMVELHDPNVVEALTGSIRVYDGTLSHYSSPADTPAELMYKARGMKARAVETLRLENPDLELYEIGNWMIALETRGSKPVTARIRMRTKLMLLKMLLEKVVKRSDQAEYLFHVATRKHARSYAMDYGAHVIQTDPIAGSEEVESLLQVSAKPFAEKLQQQIDRLQGYLGGVGQ